jgi:hypothetical protein
MDAVILRGSPSLRFGSHLRMTPHSRHAEVCEAPRNMYSHV